MALIRVVVNTGRGFGHQRSAITLMQKLREIGFNGTFDIQCNDKLGASLFNSKTGEMYINEEALVSRKLKRMIPEFTTKSTFGDESRICNNLGRLTISSLPPGYSSTDCFPLPKADLAVCAGDDSCDFNLDKMAKRFNSGSYVGLQPTDWHLGSCFVVDQDGVVKELPSATTMRLSSMAENQLPDISSLHLSGTEGRVIEISRDENINSQLIYGLYPSMTYNIEKQRMSESGNLDEAIQMQRIVQANLELSEKSGKPCILLLPQSIALESRLLSLLHSPNLNIHPIDLTKNDFDISKYKAGDVIVAYTGHLQQAVFDYLMLQGTTLPPVIEGCNSRETCESAGRPFIHGSAKRDPLLEYSVNQSDKQNLHLQASLCLEKGEEKHLPQLVQYMEETVTSNKALRTYHTERREAFLDRPDAVEVGLNSLGINISSDNLNQSPKSSEMTITLDELNKIIKSYKSKHSLNFFNTIPSSEITKLRELVRDSSKDAAFTREDIAQCIQSARSYKGVERVRNIRESNFQGVPSNGTDEVLMQIQNKLSPSLERKSVFSMS